MKAILDVIKCETDAHTLIWKHPAEDFNTHSTLIVDESQAAVLYKNGQVADVFSAGRYVLSSQNIPLLRKLIDLPTGGVSGFSCKVYFVNLVEAMNIKWGLNSKVSYEDPVYGIVLSIGARGKLSLRVGDPSSLIKNLLGTEEGIDADSLTENFRSQIVMRVKSFLTTTIKDNQISIFSIDGQLELIAEALKSRIAPDMEAYGILLKMFTLDEVIKPEDDPGYLRVKRSLSERSTGLFEAETKLRQARIAAQAKAEAEMIAAQGRKSALDTLGTTHQLERQLDVSETMAANPGNGQFSSLAGGIAMIPGAMTLGGAVAGAMNSAFQTPFFGNGAAQPQNQPPMQANAAPQAESAPAPQCPAPAQGIPGKKVCRHCGAEASAADNFCPRCGKPLPKVCPQCGRELTDDDNFCPKCGAKVQ